MIIFFKLVAILFFLLNNYVNLSDLYVDSSDDYVNLSDIYVDLYRIMMTSKWQLVALTRFDNKMLSLYSHYGYFLKSQNLTS